jgi:hypothetical protein
MANKRTESVGVFFALLLYAFSAVASIRITSFLNHDHRYNCSEQLTELWLYVPFREHKFIFLRGVT